MKRSTQIHVLENEQIHMYFKPAVKSSTVYEEKSIEEYDNVGSILM